MTAAASRLATRFGWEQHCCLPLEADCDIAPLDRYRQVGVGYVSVNVGYAPHDIDATMRVLSSWRRQLALAGEPFQLVGTADEIDAAQQAGRLVVAFDLEDTNPLGGEIAMIATYYDLGVRSMLLTYNGENLAGFGCHAPRDDGLTAFGRDAVDDDSQAVELRHEMAAESAEPRVAGFLAAVRGQGPDVVGELNDPDS